MKKPRTKRFNTLILDARRKGLLIWSCFLALEGIKLGTGHWWGGWDLIHLVTASLTGQESNELQVSFTSKIS
jgi:hypothetical protein